MNHWPSLNISYNYYMSKPSYFNELAVNGQIAFTPNSFEVATGHQNEIIRAFPLAGGTGTAS